MCNSNNLYLWIIFFAFLIIGLFVARLNQPTYKHSITMEVVFDNGDVDTMSTEIILGKSYKEKLEIWQFRGHNQTELLLGSTTILYGVRSFNVLAYKVDKFDMNMKSYDSLQGTNTKIDY